jgi:tetratricopeptide (TPR) repeat protein
MENRSRITPYLLAICSAILVFSFGCKDEFFKETAGDRITPDQHYKSMVDANVSLQGAIVTLQDAMPKLIMLDGLRSDMMEVTPNADSYLQELNYQMISSGNPVANPSDLYKVIVNINEVLANIDAIAEKDKNYDALTAYTYKGALIGMRAWTYFTLARLYNKVAYIDNNLTSLPENLSQKILTKEAIIDTLINQLETYFKSEYTTIKYTELRTPHYVNNKALLGELYLEVGRYADAAVYLKLACESYGNTAAMLKVDKSYQNAAWSTIFLNADGAQNENISVIPFSRAEAQYNPISKWVGHNYEYLVRPSTILVDSFMAQKPAAAGVPGDLWRGKGITFDADTLERINDSTFITEAFITKYAMDKEDPFSSDIIISRAADIHLLLAEAYNRMGDATSQKYALMLLNQGVNKENPKPAPFAKWSGNLGVRGRAYLKSREVPKNMISPDSITTLIEDFIIDERALELAFEGKRWTDLVRIAERRNDPAYLADKVAAKFAGTSYYDAVRNKLMNPANWYLPFN